MTVDIFFADLSEETQKAVLAEAGVKDMEEMNWDVFPLTTYECEQEEGEVIK